MLLLLLLLLLCMRIILYPRIARSVMQAARRHLSGRVLWRYRSCVLDWEKGRGLR